MRIKLIDLHSKKITTMSNSLIDQIIEDFFESIKELNEFTDQDIEKLKIIASRGELSNRSVVEEFIDKNTSTKEDENTGNTNK